MSYTFIHTSEVKKYLETEEIPIPSLKEGFKFLEGTSYLGGSTFFCDRPKEGETEFDCLEKSLVTQLGNDDHIVIYEKMDKPKTRYLYFKICVIRNANDILILKKALKAKKLKAFL